MLTPYGVKNNVSMALSMREGSWSHKFTSRAKLPTMRGACKMSCPDCRAADYISTQTQPCAWCGFKKERVLQAQAMKLWFLSEATEAGGVIALGEDEPDYSTLTEAVGGYIEYVPASMFGGQMFEYTPAAEFQPTWLINGSVSGKVLQVIVNEEGKLQGLSKNKLCTKWTYPNDVLVGNVIFQIEVC